MTRFKKDSPLKKRSLLKNMTQGSGSERRNGPHILVVIPRVRYTGFTGGVPKTSYLLKQ